jgi:hypothetical protein
MYWTRKGRNRGRAERAGATIYRATDDRPSAAAHSWRPGFWGCAAIFVGVVIVALALYLSLTA